MELQEIINDENFKSLGNTDKQVVLKGYFDDNLADDEFRNLDEETKNQVYSGFYNDHLGLEPTQEIEPVTENIITVDTPDTVPSEEAIMTQPIETVERNIQEDAIAKEEDEISLIVSRAEQLAMSGLVMNQAIGAIDSLATNKDVTDKEQNAINLALDSLYKTEKIVAHKQSEEDGQYYVMTANGNELPLDAGFLDTLKADSNKLIQAGASAYATTKAASTIIKDPRALIPIALMGSATGAATGGVQDAMISANILGVPFTPKDILETAANHGTDDLLLGGLANTAYKLAKAFGGTVSKKFKRIYNTIVNDDIDGAFDEMMKLSNKNPDEQQKIINMGAKLFGKNVPDTSTNEGKREAIKYLALFDDSIQSYTMSGARLSSENIVNVRKMVSENVNNLKNAINSQADAGQIIKMATEAESEASAIYGQMKTNLGNAFKDQTINFQPLNKSLSAIDTMLKKYSEGQLTEVVPKGLNTIKRASEDLSTMDGLIEFHKTYNSQYNKLYNNPNTTNAEKKALNSGLGFVKSFINNTILDSQVLTKSEKIKYIKSFRNANEAYSSTKKALNTELMSLLVSKGGQVKKKDKLLDGILESAKKTTKSNKTMNDSVAFMSSLTDEQAALVENSLLNRIVDKSASKTEGIPNMGDVFAEIEEVKYLFESESAKSVISTLDTFKTLWNNDDVLQYISGAKGSLSPNVTLSSSGLSKDITLVEPLKYATTARFFQKAQLVIPALLRELSPTGKVGMGIIGDWEKAGKTKALWLNIDRALNTSDSVEDIFSNLSEVKGISQGAKKTIREAMQSYKALNEELSGIPLEARIAAQEAKSDTPAPQGYGSLGKGGMATKAKTPTEAGESGGKLQPQIDKAKKDLQSEIKKTNLSMPKPTKKGNNTAQSNPVVGAVSAIAAGAAIAGGAGNTTPPLVPEPTQQVVPAEIDKTWETNKPDVTKMSKKQKIETIQALIGTDPDGKWGKKSRAAMAKVASGNNTELKEQIQHMVGTKVDGDWKSKSNAALNKLVLQKDKNTSTLKAPTYGASKASIKDLQKKIGATVDGDWGMRSKAKLDQYNGISNYSVKDKNDFVKQVKPEAERVAKKIGKMVDPSWLVTMWRHETANGQSGVTQNTYNLGNVKDFKGDSWKGDSFDAGMVWEDDAKGKATKEKSSFRKYKNFTEAANDFVKFLSTKRYAKAREATTKREFFQALKNAGYATDSKYVDKMMKL